MSKLVVTLDVPDTVDPLSTDPHEVALDILAVYTDELRAQGQLDTLPTFISAEWET